MTCGGITNDDFSQILTDMGRVVSYKVVTRTKDAITGEETTTYASAADKTVVFFLNDKRWIWDKEGLLDVGDAYIIAATSEGVKRYDQFTIDSQTFYVENVVRRTILDTAMCDYCVCFKVA